jgi:hypothetical protein
LKIGAYLAGLAGQGGARRDRDEPTHGPWCWNGFVERLTESGYDDRAVQLRGHVVL